MAWRIEGTYFESCSRGLICPCIAGFALPADGDRCEFTFSNLAFGARASRLAAKG